MTPNVRQRAVIATAIVMLVRMMLLRSRRRLSRELIRGPIISDHSGPTPNITTGLRNRR